MDIKIKKICCTCLPWYFVGVQRVPACFFLFFWTSCLFKKIITTLVPLWSITTGTAPSRLIHKLTAIILTWFSFVKPVGGITHMSTASLHLEISRAALFHLLSCTWWIPAHGLELKWYILWAASFNLNVIWLISLQDLASSSG